MNRSSAIITLLSVALCAAALIVVETLSTNSYVDALSTAPIRLPRPHSGSSLGYNRGLHLTVNPSQDGGGGRAVEIFGGPRVLFGRVLFSDFRIQDEGYRDGEIGYRQLRLANEVDLNGTIVDDLELLGRRMIVGGFSQLFDTES